MTRMTRMTRMLTMMSRAAATATATATVRSSSQQANNMRMTTTTTTRRFLASTNTQNDRHSNNKSIQQPQPQPQPHPQPQPDASTKIRLSSVQEKWQATTRHLLDPSTKLSPMVIHQFQETLKYYFTASTTTTPSISTSTSTPSISTSTSTTTDLNMCWKLLEAVAEKKEQADKTNNIKDTSSSSTTTATSAAAAAAPQRFMVPMELLQPIIHLWQRQFKQAIFLDEDHQQQHQHQRTARSSTSTSTSTSDLTVQALFVSNHDDDNDDNDDDSSQEQHSTSSSSSSSPLLVPSQVVERLQRYQNLGIIPPIQAPPQYVPAMILDVASHLSKQQKWNHDDDDDHHHRDDEGVWFAHDYLQAWIQEYNLQQQQQLQPQPQQHPYSTLIAPPDAVVVGTVLQAWVNSGLRDAPERAEQLFEEIVAWNNNHNHSNSNNSNKNPQPLVQPNAFWYNSILSAWAQQGNTTKAMEWLQRMREDSGEEPDLATWNSLLSAWAKQAVKEEVEQDATTNTFTSGLGTSGGIRPRHRRSKTGSNNNTEESARPPEQVAESILQQMQELYDQGRLAEPPDVVSYSIVLDAYSQRAWKNPPAAQRAHQWLDHMKRQDNIQPNRISYNTVIQAHARAGNAHQAEALMMEMMTESSGAGSSDATADNPDIRPDELTVAAVLTGWSQMGTWEAADRAERILHQLLPQMRMRPDVITYSACLACWAKIPAAPKQHSQSREGGRRGPTKRTNDHEDDHRNNAMERAQALFDELQAQYPEIQADVVAYTNLMNVYGRHGRAERVERILKDLLQAYEKSNHEPRLQPNVHTFSVVISAWSRSSRANGAAKAQQWLHRMSDEFGVTPNVVSYTTVLHAWSQRAQHDPQAPDRARELLRQMETSSDPNLQPNGISYTAVLRAYAQQGRAEEAEALLEDMLQANSSRCRPDVYSFSAVLQAWTKTNDCSPLEAAQRAEALLTRMHDLYYSPSLVREPPNVVCFSNVLMCWSRVMPDGAERAQAILQAMESHGVAPNIISINIVMNAWANQARNDNTAVDRARALLDQILIENSDQSKARKKKQDRTDRLRPDEYTYRAMFKAISMSSLPNRLELANSLLDEMKEQSISPSPYMMDRLRELEQQARVRERSNTQL